jgi:hypothetical protein
MRGYESRKYSQIQNIHFLESTSPDVVGCIDVLQITRSVASRDSILTSSTLPNRTPLLSNRRTSNVKPPHSPPIKSSTMSELRQRQPATSAGSSQNADSPTQRRQERRADTEASHGITTLDIIRIIATLILASCGLSYYITNSESLLWGYRPWFTRWPVVKTYLVTSPRQDYRGRIPRNPQRKQLLTLQSLPDRPC